MTLIVGAYGSMGKRYQAILNHMGVKYDTFDAADAVGFGFKNYLDYDRFIIATPTATHKAWVRYLDKFKRPILCEKPLSKNMEEVEFILKCQSPITMQMQYEYFNRDEIFSEGLSWYDFYNHGKDGIVWDCFQIIALARGEVSLKETSPIWTAGLNGNQISLSNMDAAYVWAVKRFYNGDYIDRDSLFNWHKKVSEVEAKWTT